MPYNFVPDSFHTAVTAEALRAKIGRKSPLTVFTQRNFVADFFQAKCIF